MTTPKFTPGPWMVLHDGIIATVDENGPEVACIRDDFPEFRANEHLIATAPELYEALEEIVQWLELGDHECQMHAKAVAALSKARGES